MKRFLLFAICLSVGSGLMAQENIVPIEKGTSVEAVQSSPLLSPMPVRPLYKETVSDSLHLPAINQYGQILSLCHYPYTLGSWHQWDLHRGLNVSLGASVFTQFGKHAYHGAGFSQSISAMYAVPITDRLSFAVGGYFNNVSWAHQSFQDAGISALFGYKFNERWEAYLYAQKSLVKDHYVPRPLYDMQTLGDRIGAAVRYNFSPSFYMELSVETNYMPSTGYHKQYDYPVPSR